MAHQQDPDRIITARLHAAATRCAGWKRPEGEARARAIEELRRIATVMEKPRRRSTHPPPATLRRDLLGEVAGILLGAAPASHPKNHRLAAELLRDASADEEVVQRWIPIGRERAGSSGPPATDAPPCGWP